METGWALKMMWGIIERPRRISIKSVSHSVCRVLFMPGFVSPGLMVITPLRPYCLAMQKNIPGQIIPIEITLL